MMAYLEHQAKAKRCTDPPSTCACVCMYMCQMAFVKRHHQIPNLVQAHEQAESLAQILESHQIAYPTYPTRLDSVLPHTLAEETPHLRHPPASPLYSQRSSASSHPRPTSTADLAHTQKLVAISPGIAVRGLHSELGRKMGSKSRVAHTTGEAELSAGSEETTTTRSEGSAVTASALALEIAVLESKIAPAFLSFSSVAVHASMASCAEFACLDHIWSPAGALSSLLG